MVLIAPFILPAIAGAKAIKDSGKMGGSSGGGGGSQAADTQARLAEQLFAETDPLRQQLIGRSQQFLGGGLDNSAQFNAFRATADPQFANARDSIIANTAEGGGLTAALANLDLNQARTLTQAQGDIENQELGRAFSLATGQTGQAIGGLGQAGGIQAAQAQAEAAREAGIFSAIGTGAGALLGSKD